MTRKYRFWAIPALYSSVVTFVLAGCFTKVETPSLGEVPDIPEDVTYERDDLSEELSKDRREILQQRKEMLEE